MKKVLVYGDSNTWGDNFLTGERIEDDKQWVNILQKKYKDKFLFYQEGLPGRVAGMEEAEKTYKNGQSTFIATFRTKAPIDVLIISLGTNDLQIKYNRTVEEIIEDLLWYSKELKKIFEDLDDKKKFFKGKMPKIIYILPINFDYLGGAKNIFNEESENKRCEIIDLFKEQGFDLVVGNAMDLVEDGLHLSEKGHRVMAELVERMLPNE